MEQPEAAAAALQAHVMELPLVRRGILGAARDFAQRLPVGTRVLDAGAGNSPYAALFPHCTYVTADWSQSVHPGARQADIIASLEALPVADGAFGAILCTEVLEHVERPEFVIAELHRVLEPGGLICVTTPFVWPLHEEPHDYFRYTPHALRSLFAAGGFSQIDIAATSGFVTTLAQVAELTFWLRASSDRLSTKLLVRLLRGWAWPLGRLARGGRRLDVTLEGVPLSLGYRTFAAKADRPVS